jgi:hypothetical protein
MILVERYIAFYAVAILLSGLFLTIIGVQQLEFYYAVYLIEFLVAMELVTPYRRSLERNLRPVIAVFLLGFIYVVAQQILQILG